MRTVTLSDSDDFIAVIRETDGCAVKINCNGRDLMYCFAAMTAAIRNKFETEGCEELIELLAQIVRNVLDDEKNFPLHKETRP